MNNATGKKSTLKSIVKNIIALLIFLGIPFYCYQSLTKGYDKYVVFVQANEESIFKAPLNPLDSRIIDQGRLLKDEILIMDDNEERLNAMRPLVADLYPDITVEN